MVSSREGQLKPILIFCRRYSINTRERYSPRCFRSIQRREILSFL